MGVFNLGKMTLGSLGKKPETVLYPLETKPQPEGLKGHISIDAEACILCGMCERSCPTSCITVDKGARTWTINRYSCIQCGYCVTVCPKECLHMQPGYAPAATQIASDSYDIAQAAPQAAKAPKTESAASGSERSDSGTPDVSGNSSDDDPPSAKVERRDALLEAKLAVMDTAKAKKVRDALASRMS